MSNPKEPSSATVKRLFALSGNRCAFPRCVTRIVDETGCVIGEICHIHSHRTEGPRHNANQTNAQRHGFDNLILMCSPHHKRIDTKKDDYEADKLRQWKCEHEQRFADAKVSDDGAVAAELLRKFTLNLEIGGTGNTVIMGNVHLVITKREVQKIAHDIYQTNALHHQGEAAKTATRRVKRFSDTFLEALSAGTQVASVFSSPDMQYALFAAQKAAARTDSPQLFATLIDLLVARAEFQENDLIRIVLNEAIEVTSRLTTDQMDALSLILVVRNVLDKTVVDLASFRRYFERIVLPFLRGASKTSIRYLHLQYAGCISRAGIAFNAFNVIAPRYGHVFATDIDDQHLRQALPVDDTAYNRVQDALFTLTPSGKLNAKPYFRGCAEIT